MLIKGVCLGSILMLCVMSLSPPTGSCSKACHDDRCKHFDTAFSTSVVANSLSDIAWSMVHGLKVSGGALPKALGSTPYKKSNLLFYFIGLPVLAFVAAIVGRQSKWWIVSALFSFGCVLYFGSQYQNGPKPLDDALYFYATEFCVRVGNWTGLTYWGVCIAIFVIGIPLCGLYDLGSLISRFLKRTSAVSSNA
jgi:hypothetical protein